MDELLRSELFWYAVLPALVVWVSVLVDIATRDGVGRPARVLWALGVTLFFPAALAWMLLRPTGDPLSRAAARLDPGDPRVRLADLVVQRDRGTVSDDEFVRRRDALFSGTG